MAKVEQWMLIASREIQKMDAGCECQTCLEDVAEIIASHAPQPTSSSPSDAVLTTQAAVAPEREETAAFSDKMARWEYEICDDMDLSDAWSVWHAAWSRLRDLVTTQRKEDRKEA